jgi:hypothetical protein
VEHLEVLLLLSNSSEHWWTVRAVNDLLRSSELSIQARLEELTRNGLLQKTTTPGEPDTYQFQSQPELDNLVTRLRSVYKERRVRVIETIYSPRPDAVSEFSRAFDFKKRNDK